MPRNTRPIVLLAAMAAVAAGCGSSGSSTSSSSSSSSSGSSGGGATVDKSAAALVPSKVKNKGTLVVAADATYAPNEFIAPDGKTVQGMDADLAQALAKTLGLKAK